MKKYLLKLTLIALLIPVLIPLNAQDLSIKIKADSILAPGGSCVVELIVSGGVAPYTYKLYDKEPWEGGVLLQKSSSTFDLTYSFSIQNAGSYLIAVSDNKELTKFFTITIKSAGTSYLIPKHIQFFKKYLI